MIDAGGNVYYLAKLAGIFGLDVQDIGAQQTGLTSRSFKAKLAETARRETWQGSSAASAPPCPRNRRRDRQGKQRDPYWRPFFDGFVPCTDGSGAIRPDVVVVFYNDHGLNFFLDKMPTFAIGAASEYRHADEGWGLPVSRRTPERALSWHLIEQLVADEFDVTMCQEMLVDHAFTIPLDCLAGADARPVRIVPIAINTVQHPLPSPARCSKLGRAVGRAIESIATSRCSSSAPVDCRTSWTASGPDSSTRNST